MLDNNSKCKIKVTSMALGIVMGWPNVNENAANM